MVTVILLYILIKIFISITRNLKIILPRARVAANTLKIAIRFNAIRNAYLKATIRLIIKLNIIGEGGKYIAIIRSLILFSYIVPIRVIYISLFLYKQNILLPITTTLAYLLVFYLISMPGI